MKYWYRFRRWFLREIVHREEVIISEPMVITKNTHFDKTVVFEKGGMIIPEAGVTVTLNKDYITGPIFDTDEESNHEWWGGSDEITILSQRKAPLDKKITITPKRN
jgi:hypothetical protein